MQTSRRKYKRKTKWQFLIHIIQWVHKWKCGLCSWVVECLSTTHRTWGTTYNISNTKWKKINDLLLIPIKIVHFPKMLLFDLKNKKEFLWVVDMLYILIVVVNNWLKRKWKFYHRLEYLLSISDFYTEYRSTINIIKTSQVCMHVHVQAKTWIEHILHENLEGARENFSKFQRLFVLALLIVVTVKIFMKHTLKEENCDNMVHF